MEAVYEPMYEQKMNIQEEIEGVRTDFNRDINNILASLRGDDGEPMQRYQQDHGIRTVQMHLREAVKALGALVRYWTIIHRI